MNKAYDMPKYYEISLWQGDNKKQKVDFFEKLIKKYSKKKVNRILELACGNSPLANEICNRGYQFVGLDTNPNMLLYSRKRCKEKGYDIETVEKDMLDFKLKNKVDFCFVMYNSLYRKSNEDFLRHLKQVKNSLNKGGLYVLHMVVDGSLKDIETKDRYSWDVKKGKIFIKGVFERKIIDYPNQMREEKLILNVNDNGKKIKLVEKSIDKIIFPQEFKLLIKQSGFTFVEWFDGFNINKKFEDNILAGYIVSVIRT